MKKVLSLVFACALLFGSMMPVAAQETAVATSSQNGFSEVKEGSKATLQGYEKSTDGTFYALSLLADGANEEQIKGIEAGILKSLEETAVSARSSAQDLEKLILLAEGLGYDATAYQLKGETVNLFTLLEEKDFTLVNDYSFALEALHSANYTPTADSKLNKEVLISKLLSMRNPADLFWNYNGQYNESTYGGSDPDITAMVLTSLAPYVLNDATVSGITAETKDVLTQVTKDGFTYLSGLQSTSGAIASYGNDNPSTTAMVIVAVSAFGKDLQSDAQFVKNGKTLADGLLSLASPDHKGYIGYFGEVDQFTTEQGYRALLAIEHNAVNVPYYAYQASAVINQDRFKVVETPAPEVKPAPAPVENKEQEKENIIKETAKQDSNGLLAAGWMIIVAAGCYLVKKEA